MNNVLYRICILLFIFILNINAFTLQAIGQSVVATQQEIIQRLSARHPHSIILSSKANFINNSEKAKELLEKLKYNGLYIDLSSSANPLTEDDLHDIAHLKPEIVRLQSINTTTKTLNYFDTLDECKILYINTVYLPERYDSADLAYLEVYNSQRIWNNPNPIKEAIYKKSHIRNQDLVFLCKMPKLSKLVLAWQMYPDEPTTQLSESDGLLVTKEGIDLLAKVVNLTDLVIDRISADDLPYMFAKLTNLRRLIIHSVNYPEGWNDHLYFYHYDTIKLCRNILKMENLETLYLGNMPQLNAMDLSFFASCPQLKNLSLYGSIGQCVPDEEMEKFLDYYHNSQLTITGAQETTLEGFEIYSCPICTKRKEGGMF